MHKILTCIAPIALTAALVATGVSAEPTTGSIKPSTQLLADSCAACHGTDGNSPGSIDEINGMKRSEFIEEMREFKYEQGKGRIMGPIARGLSDAQIDALAGHFQTLKR